jgi:hypothetical protein
MTSTIATLTPLIADEIIWRKLDKNAVIVSPHSGEVRVLNEVGTVIWILLTQKRAVADIASHLADHYQVTLRQAQQDVILFLQELQERGLVQWPDSVETE